MALEVMISRGYLLFGNEGASTSLTHDDFGYEDYISVSMIMSTTHFVAITTLY